MVDFTSSLYLGLQHPSAVLPPWQEFTTGVPAALREPPGARELASRLALLLGCAAGAVARSTLHLACDVFAVLSSPPLTVHLDAGAYPISRWGARQRGLTVREFPRHDADALERALSRDAAGPRPLVVTDGFCPARGRPAPLARYLESVRRRGGWLLVDDTQALGILGHDPTPAAPHGHGGGGSLRWQQVRGPEIVVIASLAKAFGAPLAVVAGSAEFVARYRAGSDTRVHCSPPSAADLAAADHALALNRHEGDARRRCLRERITQFRQGLAAHGLGAAGGLFPVQSLPSVPAVSPERLHHRLLRRGIVTALLRGDDARPRVGCLIRASHSRADIDRAVQEIARAAGPPGPAFSPSVRRVPTRPFPSRHPSPSEILP